MGGAGFGAGWMHEIEWGSSEEILSPGRDRRRDPDLAVQGKPPAVGGGVGHGSADAQGLSRAQKGVRADPEPGLGRGVRLRESRSRDRTEPAQEGTTPEGAGTTRRRQLTFIFPLSGKRKGPLDKGGLRVLE